jgi:RNA polymerase sigma factor (sigma-70 family)
MVYAPYSDEEVRALVAHYNTLKYRRHRPWIQVRLLDLEVGLTALPTREREALVLYGILGYTQRQVASMMGVSQRTVGRDIERAIVKLVERMNGQV